jgi:tricorn protease-like protein
MRRCLCSLVFVAAVLGAVPAQPVPEPGRPKLLLAFASTRERRDPPYPKIYFYEHDGVAKGKLLESIPTISKGTNNSRADMHPSLSHDGRFCAFSAQLGVQDGARIAIWDRKEGKLLDLPAIQESPKIHQMGASVSGDGKVVAYSAWARPGSSTRWGVFLYDVATRKAREVRNLNHDTFDLRMPALSGDGRLLAYASNKPGGVGATDIYLYDLVAGKSLSLPEMNSKGLDIQPALSGDGRLVAFSSDRPSGAGGRDIYLYDRTARKFLPLPGLNSGAPEQSPSLSADGRYLVFVSERLSGAGERDIYLYDRATQKLLPTPGLNSKEDDFDPCLIVMAGQK